MASNGQSHIVMEKCACSIDAIAGPGDMQLVYGEAQCPNYRRQFTLSRELDTQRVEAQLRDGVLRLTIPKAEDARPRRIQVQVG
jgi:HSP20 family molecular chaperone IbpA